MLCIKVTVQSPNDFGQIEFPDRQQCIWQFSNKVRQACRVRMHKEEKTISGKPFIVELKIEEKKRNILLPYITLIAKRTTILMFQHANTQMYFRQDSYFRTFLGRAFII